MKNITERKTISVLVLMIATLNTQAQSEQELLGMMARFCKLDSVNKTLGFVAEGDSIPTFNFLTPSYEDFGVPSYDFEESRIVFDIGSNLMVSGHPYGKIEVTKHTKSKTEIHVTLARAGDREKMGKWVSATFKFSRPKNGRWLMAGADYIMTEE